MSAAARIAIAIAGIVAAVAILAAPPARAAGDLAQNGAFTAGEGARPTAWRTESWIKTPEATRYSWAVGDTGIGVVSIENLVANDATWVQTVPVSPSTWYRVSAWIQSENVGSEHLGAYVSVLDTFFNSQDLRGTQPWQPVVLWVKTKPLETSIRIGCRLGGYASLNTGSAQFSLVSVAAAGKPPVGAPFVYGGSAEQVETRQPIWAQLAAIVVAVCVALVLWRYLLPAAR